MKRDPPDIIASGSTSLENPAIRARRDMRERLLMAVYDHTSLPPVPGLTLGVWLFGSFATGEWTGISDLDLLYAWSDAEARRVFWRSRPSLETFLKSQDLRRAVDVVEAIGQEEVAARMSALRELGGNPVMLWPTERAG